jgi:5-methylcytosine-specific restriction protein A
MPTRALRICSAGGCRTVVKSGRCAKHQAMAEAQEAERKRAIDAQRPSSGERGYDADWRAVRRQFLAANPTCVGFGVKEGRCGQPSTEADHVVSVAQAPDLRLRWSNLRAYCHACHSARTATAQGFARPRQDGVLPPMAVNRRG